MQSEQRGARSHLPSAEILRFHFTRGGRRGVSSRAFVWRQIRAEALRRAAADPGMTTFMIRSVSIYGSTTTAVAARISILMADAEFDACTINRLMMASIFHTQVDADALVEDLLASSESALSQRRPLDTLLFSAGFHGLVAHRLAHGLWMRDRRSTALWISHRASERFGVDIHPSASHGRRVHLSTKGDILVGPAVHIGNDVVVGHGVTLIGPEDGGGAPLSIEPGTKLGLSTRREIFAEAFIDLASLGARRNESA
jgi:serine O-acetyltransferase